MNFSFSNLSVTTWRTSEAGVQIWKADGFGLEAEFECDRLAPVEEIHRAALEALRSVANAEPRRSTFVTLEFLSQATGRRRSELDTDLQTAFGQSRSQWYDFLRGTVDKRIAFLMTPADSSMKSLFRDRLPT